jgi:hypothetical protein
MGMTIRVALIASAERTEMLYGDRVVEGLIKGETALSLGLGLEPVGEEEAIQSGEARPWSIRLF